MREPVLIKSSRYGIVLYLDSDMPYLNLLSAVKGKFEASAHFFAHADMTVEFVGRTFTKEEALRCRLLDMGLIPGTAVSVRKIAPLGDPMEIRLRGYELTLRREDAKKIGVKAEGET